MSNLRKKDVLLKQEKEVQTDWDNGGVGFE